MDDYFSPNENEKLQKTINSLKNNIKHLEGPKKSLTKIIYKIILRR